MVGEFILLGIAAFLAYLYFNNGKYKNLPPGPRGLPFLGNLHQFGATKPHIIFPKWQKEYGDIFYVKLGTAKMIVIGDAKILRDFYSHGSEYTGRMDFELINDIYNNAVKAHGIANTQGDDWEQLRRFALRQLRDFGFGKQSMESYVMDEATDLIDWIKSLDGKPIDNLKEKFLLAVVNSLWTIVSGKRCRQDDAEIMKIANDIVKSIVETTEKGNAVFFAPWIRHILPDWSGYTAMRKAFDEFRGFLQKTVHEHQESYSPDYSRDFIDVFLKEIKESTDPNSAFYGEEGERQLVGSLADLFFAGSDTTSTTLAWTILYLSKFKEVQKKLQQEIGSVTNNNSRSCCLADRPNMPYVEATIAEILRYSALLPMGVPHTALVTKEYNGYTIPKGSTIVANVKHIHFDTKIWGDPENFRPERFLDASNKFMKNDSLIAFSVGKRQCLGESLARDTLFLFVTNIYQKFNVEVVGEHNLEPEVSFLLMPKPFSCVFKERK